MSEYHTSENLAQLFFSIVHEEWGLTGRVFSITCDNASNNDGAIRLIAARDPLFTEENHFRCFAHVVKLVVQQLLKYGEEELCKLRHIVGFVNKSTKRLVEFYRMVVEVESPSFCILDHVLHLVYSYVIYDPWIDR